MPSQGDAFLRHQQARFMRPDAARFIRPDAARFLKPGTRVEDVFPALALKYSPNQPRVAAGNPDGGQWTGGGGGSARPRVIIDTTDFDTPPQSDVYEDVGSLGLFDITPPGSESLGVQLAGDPPGIGDNGGPPLDEPPTIPQRMPDTGEDRMKFVRDAARWIAKVGRYSPLAEVFFGTAEQVNEINRLTDIIRTANDPPRSLQELRDRVNAVSEKGYQDHHIIGQHDQNRRQFGRNNIDSYENTVRIPTLQHFEINAWYSRQNRKFGGLTPRDYLRGRSWEEQMNIGLNILRERGIMK